MASIPPCGPRAAFCIPFFFSLFFEPFLPDALGLIFSCRAADFLLWLSRPVRSSALCPDQQPAPCLPPQGCVMEFLPLSVSGETDPLFLDCSVFEHLSFLPSFFQFGSNEQLPRAFLFFSLELFPVVRTFLRSFKLFG